LLLKATSKDCPATRGYGNEWEISIASLRAYAARREEREL
jgi:hypothetical protein